MFRYTVIKEVGNLTLMVKIDILAGYIFENMGVDEIITKMVSRRQYFWPK